MNTISNNEELWTIKELADHLNVKTDTIKWHIRKLYPNLMKQGISTCLNEEQRNKIIANIKEISPPKKTKKISPEKYLKDLIDETMIEFIDQFMADFRAKLFKPFGENQQMNQKIITDEPISDKQTTDELITDGVIHKFISKEEPISDKQITDELMNLLPISEEFTSDKFISGDVTYVNRQVHIDEDGTYIETYNQLNPPNYDEDNDFNDLGEVPDEVSKGLSNTEIIQEALEDVNNPTQIDVNPVKEPVRRKPTTINTSDNPKSTNNNEELSPNGAVDKEDIKEKLIQFSIRKKASERTKTEEEKLAFRKQCESYYQHWDKLSMEEQDLLIAEIFYFDDEDHGIPIFFNHKWRGCANRACDYPGTDTMTVFPDFLTICPVCGEKPENHQY